MLGDQVAVEVLQSHFGHSDPLLGVVAHGGTGRLTRHCHGYLKRLRQTDCCVRAYTCQRVEFVGLDG